MGMIYLAQPRGNRIRSIDKLKPKDRKKPANCNDSNVKFGKHLSNLSDLKDRYERLVGDVDVRVGGVVNVIGVSGDPEFLFANARYRYPVLPLLGT